MFSDQQNFWFEIIDRQSSFRKKYFIVYTSYVHGMTWINIASGNGLSLVRCEEITWTNNDTLSIETFGTDFIEIWINIHKFSIKKIHKISVKKNMKISSAECAPLSSDQSNHWFCAKLYSLQCISYGVTAVLLKAISNYIQWLFNYSPTDWGLPDLYLPRGHVPGLQHAVAHGTFHQPDSLPHQPPLPVLLRHVEVHDVAVPAGLRGQCTRQEHVPPAARPGYPKRAGWAWILTLSTVSHKCFARLT